MCDGSKPVTLRTTEWKNSIKYISGPISHGDMQENMDRAIMVGEFYYRHGFPCYIPHLDKVWSERYPKPYADWIHLSKSILMLLKQQDELVRLPGYSPGSDGEIEAIAKETFGPSVKIMTVSDCEEIEEALGESFPYLPEGQAGLKGLTSP